MLKSCLSLMVALALAAPADGGQGVQVWSADTIAWRELRPGGTQRTFLDGDPARAGGVVTYAFHIPAGTWFPPHTHPTAARVFVLKGALLLGEGPVEDRAHVRRIAPGEVAFVPADLAHYEGATEDTVIVGVAPAPFETRFLARAENYRAAAGPQ